MKKHIQCLQKIDSCGDFLNFYVGIYVGIFQIFVWGFLQIVSGNTG
jgi:hypothetical protein